MSSTTQETPKIVAPVWDSLLTGLAVGVVAGIGIGVVATSKDVISTLAAGCAGAGAGSAIAYFVADYRHTDRRNTLAAQIVQAEDDRTQLQQEVMNERRTALELETKLQEVVAQYDQLAQAADAEVQRLKTLIPVDAVSADAVSPSPSIEVDMPLKGGETIEPISTAEPQRQSIDRSADVIQPDLLNSHQPTQIKEL